MLNKLIIDELYCRINQNLKIISYGNNGSATLEAVRSKRQLLLVRLDTLDTRLAGGRSVVVNGRLSVA